MKKVCIIIAALALFAMGYAQEIRVNNAKDFLRSIDSDKTIIIESGAVFNLSEAISQLHEEDPIKYPIAEYVDPAKILEAIIDKLSGSSKNTDIDIKEDPIGVSFKNDKNGLPYVVINGLHNLTIKGESPNPPTLLVEPSGSSTLEFIYCDHITLDRLIISHTGQDHCSTLQLYDSRNIRIQNCEFMGRGGTPLKNDYHCIESMDVIGFDMVNSRVHDCPNGIMSFAFGNKIHFENCEFYNCALPNDINKDNPEDVVPQTLLQFYSNDKICFDKCIIYQNQGPLFYGDNIKLKNCFVSHPSENLGDISQIKDKKSVWFNAPK